MAEITIDGLRYEILKRTKTARVKNVAQGYKSQGSFTILPSVKFEGELLRVIEIGDEAFEECKAVTISIPNTITHIGNWAFLGCSGLTSITIPNSVTSIGHGAFWGCSGLTSITIPESVTSIGNRAFWGCSGLTSIVVKEGNSTYDSRDNCNAIIETTNNTLIRGCQNTTIANSVTSIGKEAFDQCKGLTSITIPERVTSIGKAAFYQCKGLTSITIPESVTSIGERAFDQCKGLTSITIPNSVTSIGYKAFLWCSGLTSITIPNSVTSIGEGAFYHCESLTSITIPYSVTTIGKGALGGCDKLDTIIIENTPENITFDFANNSDDQWISKVQFVGQPENVEQLKAAAAARIASAAQKAAPKEAAAPAETPTAEPTPAPATPAATTSAEGQMTIAQLAADFKNQFGSVLRVYNGRSKADDSLTLQEVGLTGNIAQPFDGNQKVGEFIEQMKTIGLKVKVYTCDEWIACIDGLTLSATGKVTKYACKADMEKML